MSRAGHDWLSRAQPSPASRVAPLCEYGWGAPGQEKLLKDRAVCSENLSVSVQLDWELSSEFGFMRFTGKSVCVKEALNWLHTWANIQLKFPSYWVLQYYDWVWASQIRSMGYRTHPFKTNQLNSIRVFQNVSCVKLLDPNFWSLVILEWGNCKICPDQYSSVTQSCPTLCDPVNRRTPGLPIHHQLPEFTQTHVHRVGNAIQPSHPLLSPSPPAPNPSQHQGLFQWVNSSHEVAKVLEFQLQYPSFQWTPRTDLL